jgi:uncharacterized protein
MRISDLDIFMVAGWGGSGEDHWQTRWQSKLSTARRVEQTNWDAPQHALWVNTVSAHLAQAERPALIIAHSLGVYAAVHAVLNAPEMVQKNIAGVFMVAPPALQKIHSIPEIDTAFAHNILHKIDCPAVVVGSETDPYASLSEAEELAHAWQVDFTNAGDVGHINTESGHGPWPEGLMRLAGFLKSL